MSSSKLLASFIGRMAYYGLIVGPVVAFAGWLTIFLFLAILSAKSLEVWLVGLLLYMSLSVVYGLIYGLILGILIGGISGAMCGAVTLLFFRNKDDERVYIRTMMATSGLSAFPLGMVIVGATYSSYAVVEIPLINTFGLIGGILAACGATYAGRHVASWYIQSQHHHTQSVLES